MKFLSIFALLILSLNAKAADNPRVMVNSADNFALYKSNNQNIADIETINTALEGVVANYQTCIDKGLVYLGAGASNVDADNCYDVANTLNPDTRFRVTPVGAEGGIVLGNRGGRFAVDAACNAAHAGSRALVYSDLIHIFPLINKVEYTGAYARFWVFDDYKRADNTVSNLSCNGWTSNTSSYSGMMIQQNGGVYTLTSQTCDTGAYILCVEN